MVVQDPLLCDLPIQVTLEEVNSQIALEYGQAMTVRVCKMDGEIMRKCSPSPCGPCSPSCHADKTLPWLLRGNSRAMLWLWILTWLFSRSCGCGAERHSPGPEEGHSEIRAAQAGA
ncbi:U11/U12 small nuclear ribonucleoprotein 25 kDa protein isoform X1 [Canis lupus baileyi]|uniref:U11/U12 small nuclear ribonucleoprotein 25 kDa protein isoform X2 n=1 Tax=Canis lupus dingo TaxID=286419 RepID=UPI0015F12F26|nr:U11/U12 small nuclear ribonucleoprotein 25 kDa protein isoform X2 [Canis lupus dingo]XP_038396919.1 U11/U12 small nuclear ribonucleoprotein 25 kDa protein isoform X2 [Canis lupus familiaris]XP_038407531.1 U11/U12 small nuclear ribonucleoprotein 25 kDa protein isoform X2 [Canis lupus familiaris]XP_038525717.1 U11/U12 small nuclear ribonucleoprotein 25 kDa protein isoform X2 [Canis lupus familiaris]